MRWIIIFTFFSGLLSAQFPNVLVSSQFDPRGVSIAINPKNYRQIIAGAGMANAYYSEDAGNTWKKSDNICNAFNLYGQPFVFWDTARKAYYSDLALLNPKVVTDGSWIDRIIVNRSEDFGKTYTNCEDFGKNGKKVQYKHWVCVDQKTNVIHAAWTQFNKFESNQPGDTSIIRYSKSLDGGKRWTEPKRLSYYAGDCKNSDSTVMGASVCLSPGGDVYICWAGPKGIVFQKSLNDGESWLAEERIIHPIKNGWNYKVNGVYNANGLPSMACDLSNGAYKGRIYICWSDEKNGEKNKDVFLIYSDDKGENWTDPILVTYHPNHKEQFMPAITIDQSTGNVYIIYYDQENFYEEGMTDVYMAVSKNGGLKFDLYKINDKPFMPLKDGSFGDCTGISACNGVVRPIWMQQDRKKELNVYTAIIDEKGLQKYNAERVEEMDLPKTFKYSDEVTVNFNLKKNAEVIAAITRPLEPGFEKKASAAKKFKAGNNSMLINFKQLGLQKGTYILTLYYNNKNSFAWIINE
ncbi:MAG: hypothetical protein ACXVNM_04605 [Bacteroidia bacterium]